MTAGGRSVDAASAVGSAAAAVRSPALPAAGDGRGPQAAAHHEDGEEPSSGCVGMLWACLIKRAQRRIDAAYVAPTNSGKGGQGQALGSLRGASGAGDDEDVITASFRGGS